MSKPSKPPPLTEPQRYFLTSVQLGFVTHDPQYGVDGWYCENTPHFLRDSRKPPSAPCRALARRGLIERGDIVYGGHRIAHVRLTALGEALFDQLITDVERERITSFEREAALERERQAAHVQHRKLQELRAAWRHQHREEFDGLYSRRIRRRERTIILQRELLNLAKSLGRGSNDPSIPTQMRNKTLELDELERQSAEDEQAEAALKATEPNEPPPERVVTITNDPALICSDDEETVEAEI